MSEARLGDGFAASGKDAVQNKKAQGFTINSSTGKFFSARVIADNDITMTRVISSGDEKGKIDAILKNRKLGHANDCAYYKGRIFIAPQNGEQVIYSYPTSLKEGTKEAHSYEGKSFDEDDFSGIAYITGSGGWFVLQRKRSCVCAFFDGSKFIGVSKFTLPKVESIIQREDLGGVSGQGIYVDQWALYKLFSHHDKTNHNIITRNDIVSYALSDSYPSYTQATYCNHYQCDKTALNFFEAEGLSEYNGTRYISATTKKGSKDGYENRFYKVTL